MGIKTFQRQHQVDLEAVAARLAKQIEDAPQ